MNDLAGSPPLNVNMERPGQLSLAFFDVSDIYGRLPAFDHKIQREVVRLLDQADGYIEEAASLVSQARRIVGIEI